MDPHQIPLLLPLLVLLFSSASFATGNLTVNYTAGGTAAGNNSTFISPANLTISAIPSLNFHFVNWTATTGNCTVNNTTSASTFVEVFNDSVCTVEAAFGQYTTIAIAYPANNSTVFNQTYTDLNFTISSTNVSTNTSVNSSDCWFSINSTSATNYTLAGCRNSTVALNSLPPGNYSLAIYVKNTQNETVSATVLFSTITANNWEPGLYIGGGVVAVAGAAVFYSAWSRWRKKQAS